MRKAQLPARTFQLLARQAYKVPKQKLDHSGTSNFHTTPGLLRQQQQRASYTDPYTTNEPDTTVIPTLQNAQLKAAPKATPKQVALQSEQQDHPVREYMRHITHPVAIITSTDTNIHTNGGPPSWRGATVSSFNSVTLDPTPYVSFNITKRSSTYAAIKSSKFFAVHLMSNTPEAIELATHFSQGNGAEPFLDKSSTPQGTVPKPHTFVSIIRDWEPLVPHSAALPPTLWWRKDHVPRAVIFQFLCEYQADKVFEVGDHVIVIGKVLAKRGTLDNKKEFARHKANIPSHCLTYAHGKYTTRWTRPSRHFSITGRKDGEEEKAAQEEVKIIKTFSERRSVLRKVDAPDELSKTRKFYAR